MGSVDHDADTRKTAKPTTLDRMLSAPVASVDELLPLARRPRASTPPPDEADDAIPVATAGTASGSGRTGSGSIADRKRGSARTIALDGDTVPNPGGPRKSPGQIVGSVIARAIRGLRGIKRAKTVDPTIAATSSVVNATPTVSLPERPYDLVLLLAVLGLLVIGTIEIYSSTAATTLTHAAGEASTAFLSKQIVFASIGGVAMYIGARADYRLLKRYSYPLLAGAIFLLGVALLMHAKNGAKRWIPLGPLTFQPVEIAKLALVAYLSTSLARKADRVKTFTIGFVPHLVVCGIMMALLLKQPDLGSSVVLGATTLGLLFIAGTRVSYIMLAVLGAAPVAYHLVVGTPWRLQRFLAYFNPEAFANGEAYQYLQSRLALGSGGLTGMGLGEGHQTLGYMPEAHNDFILAPIGEEMGFVGVAIVLVCFAILLWRGIRAALGARDTFGGYLAFGITFLFGVQVLFNVGVVLGVVPNKGITLPLVSYGGSSLVITMFFVGLLLNIGRRPQIDAAQKAEAIRELARRKRARVKVAIA